MYDFDGVFYNNIDLAMHLYLEKNTGKLRIFLHSDS